MNPIRIISLLLSAFCVLVVFNSCHAPDERKLAETQVPAAILSTFAEMYPNAVVREYSEEVEEGQNVYEISFRVDGRKMEILYLHDGTVIETVETISDRDLPVSIKDALKNNFGNSEIKETKRVYKDSDVFYEVEISVLPDGGAGAREILFSAEGKVMEEEDEEDID